jgi:type I restriction enzyme S subunit
MTSAKISTRRLRIADVADVTLGKTPKRSEYRSDGRHRLFKYRDIQGNALVLGQTKDGFVVQDPAVLRTLCTVDVGDVLVGASGHTSESIGRKVAIVKSLPPGGPHYVAGELLRIRPDRSALDSRWIRHFLSSDAGFKTLQGAVSGVHLTTGRAREMVIPIAPLGVQQSISEFLDNVMDGARSASMHLSAAERAIKRFRQAILAAACAGRLTADWRADRPVSEQFADNVLRRSREMLGVSGTRKVQDSVEPTWLELPESWRWAPLRDLAAIKGGIQKQPKRAPKNNAFPYLRVANVLRGRLDLSEISQFELFGGELDTYRLETGDLLVVEGNGSEAEIGRSALWNGEIANCVHQNHIIRVRCMLMDPRFVDLFWNSPIAASEISSLAVTSAGLYSLSTKKIGAVRVPVVPIDEQRVIVERASQMLASADEVLGRIEATAASMESAGKAVLATAFQGRLMKPEASTASP